MKKILLFLMFIAGVCLSTHALTYEEAYNSLKSAADLRGVTQQDTVMHHVNGVGTLLNVDNLKIASKSNETDGQTEYYGNLIFDIMKQLPVSEIVNSYIGEGVIFTIYTRPSATTEKYDMLILYTTTEKGFTWVMTGQINANDNQLLQNSIISYDGFGDIGIYTELFGFGAH